MKKLLVPALLTISALAAAQEKYTVKGKIGQLDAPVRAFLRYSLDGKVVTDSALLEKGVFTFKGDLPYALKASLTLRYTEPQPGVPASLRQDMISVYLEKGTISIVSTDSLRKATVSGTQLNADNKRLDIALKPVTDKSAALLAHYYSLSAEDRKNKEISDELDRSFKENSEQRKAVLKKYIQENPATLVSLDALKLYGGSIPDYGDVTPLYNSLGSKIKQHPDAVKYQERLEKLKQLSLGAIAPDFTQNDPDGKPVTLASFRGKYVLVDFWASWCGPCRAENPTVVKVFNEYKAKNFTILGVSLDQPDGRSKWLKAIEDDQLAWTHVSDLAFWKNAVAQQYAVNAIPQNYLLDPQGRIIAKNLRGEALAAKLKEILN